VDIVPLRTYILVRPSQNLEHAMMERRTAQRSEPSSLLKARIRAPLPVRLIDFSTRGAQLELREPLAQRASCELRLVADSVDVTVRAMVRRCRVWGWGASETGEKILLYRAGVQFEEASVPTLCRLTELMPQLFAGAPHTVTLHPAGPVKGSG